MLAALFAILYVVLRPMYGDYMDRAHVADTFALLHGIKTPLAERYANTGGWPATLQGDLAPTSGRYTRSIAITGGGGKSPELELTATLRETGVDRRVAGKTVRVYTKDGGKTWKCAAGTAPERSMPAGCRAGT